MAISNFTRIPILSLVQARSEETEPAFLAELRDVLPNVGFLYLSDTGLPPELVEEARKSFEDLAEWEKEAVEMRNQKSFLGWSRLNNETTAGRPDYREQLDLSTPHPIPGSDAPLYHNLLAPNQWPSPTYLPNSRPAIRGLRAPHVLHQHVLHVPHPPSARYASLQPFDRFSDANQQHKLKTLKYPDCSIPASSPTSTSSSSSSDTSTNPNDDDDAAARQGVVPHKDSMLTPFLLQASPQRGSQAQKNTTGGWIDATPPSRARCVVAIGQGMEALTGGVCARYSVPFFQGVSYDARFEGMDVPAGVQALEEELVRRWGGRRDDVGFAFAKGSWGHLGEAALASSREESS